MVTIFILCEHPLFARGLEHLLRQERDVEIVGVATEREKALTQIRTIKPDVILVEADHGRPDAGTLLSTLVQDRGEGRVLSVSFNRNEAVLYTGRRWKATRARDLIEGIKPTKVVS